MKTFLKLSLIAATLVTLSPIAFVGCAATNSAVSSVRGEVKSLFSSDMETAFQTASLAIAELKFAKVAEKHDALTGYLTSTTADGTKIEIHLRAETEKVVSVSIRVGTFGDERIAQAILARMKERL